MEITLRRRLCKTWLCKHEPQQASRKSDPHWYNRLRAQYRTFRVKSKYACSAKLTYVFIHKTAVCDFRDIESYYDVEQLNKRTQFQDNEL